MQWNGCKLHQNLDDKQQLYIKEAHFIKIKFRNGNTNKEIIEMSKHVFDRFAPNVLHVSWMCARSHCHIYCSSPRSKCEVFIWTVNMFSPFHLLPSFPVYCGPVLPGHNSCLPAGGAESRTEPRGKITGYTDTGKTMDREGEIQSKGADFYQTVADWEKAEHYNIKPHISCQ